MKTTALALMAAASFCAGVRHKRYSVQQETAPDKNQISILGKHHQIKTLNLCFFAPLNPKKNYFCNSFSGDK